jgi:ABC-2 type transport system ATP-binding protein
MVSATTPTLDLEGVIDVQLYYDCILVTAAGGSKLPPAVMRDLESKGHRVTSLDVRPASLEEVFVDMTREEREGGRGDVSAMTQTGTEAGTEGHDD